MLARTSTSHGSAGNSRPSPSPRARLYSCLLYTSFPLVNEVYKQHFKAPCPARSCVEVSALPLGVQVEIEAIAVA